MGPLNGSQNGSQNGGQNAIQNGRQRGVKITFSCDTPNRSVLTVMACRKFPVFTTIQPSRFKLSKILLFIF